MAVTIIKNLKIPDSIKLKEWCRLTGETEQAVYQRISAGKWLLNVQYIKVEGKIWIEYKQAQKWLKNPTTATLQGLKALK